MKASNGHLSTLGRRLEGSTKAAVNLRLAVFTALFTFVAFSSPSASNNGVERYGDRVEVELYPEEEAGLETVASVVEGRDKDQLRLDKRLTLTAREVARELQRDASRQKEVLSSRNINSIMHKYGIYEISFNSQYFTYGTSGDIKSQIRLLMKDTKPYYTHMGVGVARPDNRGRTGVAVVLLSDVRTRLSPFPIKVRVPSSWTLRGRLVYSSRDHKPSILLTPPSGEVEVVSSSSTGDTFSASIPFSHGPGIYRIEVVSRGIGTSQVAALLEVEAGYSNLSGSAAFEISGFDDTPASEREAERMVVGMINQVRDKEGLSELTVDDTLVEMARAHSRDMKKFQFVGHKSPKRGTLQDRILEAGLDGYVIRENVALDSSLVHAMNNLLQSPVHRAPIFSPDVNSVGVGIVFDYSRGTRHYYVTQEFAKFY